MSISEKIRELARDGVSTADIARQLGIRYQHAYNVLKAGRARVVSSETVLAARKNRPDGVAAVSRVSVLHAMGGDPLVVEGYRFERVTDLAPVRMMDGTVRAFMPQNEYANEDGLRLNKYGTGPFCKKAYPIVSGETNIWWVTGVWPAAMPSKERKAACRVRRRLKRKTNSSR